jgi:hypothetical protein
MSMSLSESLGQNPEPQDAGLERRPVAEWPSSGMLLAGLAVVGIGALAWYYLGPDLIRYMKIRNM